MTWWDAVRIWLAGRREKKFPVPGASTPEPSVEYNGASEWLSKRANLTTVMNSREIAESWTAKARAQAFFAARVAEDRILERLRRVSDAYSRGEIGHAEARTELKRFLRGEGKDDGTNGLRNLASTARLDLILEQNARMAAAVGQYQAGMDPDIRERFPCWRYIGSTALNPRDSHARFAGKVFRKDDPIWHKIFPPSDFNCKCSVEDCDDEPDRVPETIEPPESGFTFDPAHAFEEFDLSRVKSAEERGNIREAAEIVFGDQVSFGKDNATAKFEPKTYRTFEEEGLPSAKEWDAAPSPKRILPETARKRLEAGFEVVAGDGRKVVMDRAVLEHWTVENNKLPSDVESRLACLDYAQETLENPCERWDQETQSRYLKIFKRETGKIEGCMVVVTNDGKCRTYFLPSVNQVNKARTGISFDVLDKHARTGRSAASTTEAIAAPGRSDDLKDNNTPKKEKVKGISFEHRQKRLDQKKRAWGNRVERSGLPEAVQRELKDFNIGAIPQMPKLVLDHPDFQNTGYAPQSNILNIRHTADASDISHELTHVWQIQRQKIFPDLREEIRNAQKKDWERLKKVWGGKVGDYDLERISTQNRLAQAMFRSEYGNLNRANKRTIAKFIDAVGSISGGEVGGSHGTTRAENRNYFRVLDSEYPAQEALAQIRCEVKHGDERFGQLFPELTKILKTNGVL